MYDLLDVQTLFSTDESIKVIKELLSTLNISYIDHKTVLELKFHLITFIHTKILIISPSQPTEILYSNNKDHMKRLVSIISQSY